MWRGRALAAAVALEGRLGEVDVRARLGHEVEGLPRRRGGGEHWLARRLALARRRLARVRARQLLAPEPSPLENVARFLRGVAAVLERIARTGGIPLGVVLAVTQAQGVTIQLPNFLAPRGDEQYAGEGFLFDGPCDPAMR